MRRFRLGVTLTACAMLVFGGGVPARAQTGWTALSPAAGARVVYVSSSTGSDSNSGLSTAAPVQSLSRGYALLRDGSPDWLLLKAGDSWNEGFQAFNKSANSTTQYMVIASYGVGPRPRLRTPAGGSAVFGYSSVSRRGLAIVDLDLAPAAPTNGAAGLFFLDNWGHILVEGCSIVGYPDNIVIEDSGGVHRLVDIKIRRCVIADSTNAGSGHSQGVFMRNVDDWTIEGCVIDNNGRQGLTPNTMFRHNVYVHETCGAGIFNDNVSARASSHGAQQRPGGEMQNNLYLQNSINAYQGSAAGVPNVFRYNVALDSKNINEADQRGMGFVMGGNTTVEYNVAAHQEGGTGLGAVKAFNFDGAGAVAARGNVVYDWKRPGAGDGSAYCWEGGAGPVLFEGNVVYQPAGGMCIRHEDRALSSSFTYRGNKYWTINPFAGYAPFATSTGVGANWQSWLFQAGESGTVFANPGSFNARIDTYLQSIGMTGSVAEFMAQARQQSKAYWRAEYTSPIVNDWVRARFGLPQVGGGPITCYANCDGSTAPPVLSVSDFVCFITRFASQHPAANCDNSVTPPVLTANDFVCFATRFAAGCS